MDVENGVIRFEYSKTGHKSSVPLDQFRAVLKAHKKVLKKWSPIAFKKSPYVFPQQGDPADLKHGGMRHDTAALNKCLARCCRLEGIPRVTFHDFRRTFVSLALESGIAPDVIRSMTGHSEQMIGHYHHQSQGSKRDLISVVKGTENDSKNDTKIDRKDQIVTASKIL